MPLRALGRIVLSECPFFSAPPWLASRPEGLEDLGAIDAISPTAWISKHQCCDQWSVRPLFPIPSKPTWNITCILCGFRAIDFFQSKFFICWIVMFYEVYSLIVINYALKWSLLNQKKIIVIKHTLYGPFWEWVEIIPRGNHEKWPKFSKNNFPQRILQYF